MSDFSISLPLRRSSTASDKAVSITSGAAVTSSGTPHLSPKIPVLPKQRSKETSPRGDVEAGTRLASTAGPPDSKWNKAGQFFEHSITC